MVPLDGFDQRNKHALCDGVLALDRPLRARRFLSMQDAKSTRKRRPGHLATCGASSHLPRRITPNPLHLSRVAGGSEVSVVAINREMDRCGNARPVATVGRYQSRPLLLEG